MAVEEKKKEWAVEKKRMIRQGKGKIFRKVTSLEDDILAGIRIIRGSVGGLPVLEY